MPAEIQAYMTGWGHRLGGLSSVARPARMDAFLPTANPCVARGLGRSYGDAAINTNGHLILTERLQRILEFDTKTGRLRAESGISLNDILRVSVPRGWFPAVTPGTKHVSLGGCVAADVHGKNHHRDGSFGRHVQRMSVVLADGSQRVCDRTQNAELFWSTLGGMGLTGLISDVTVMLQPIETNQIHQQHKPALNVDQMFKYFEDPSFDDHYTVAWIDGLAKGKNLGRGIFMQGHHASRAEAPAAPKALAWQPQKEWPLPFYFPPGIMNAWAIAAFNRLYHWSGSRKRHPFLSGLDTFFYPLDRLQNWPRLYGRRGFLQYQCVIPMKNAHTALPHLLELFALSRRASFLAVLKRMGPEGQGLLSFPLDGYTLALDIPAGDPDLFPFLNQLDQIVLTNEGRVYLAKDCRMKAATLSAMYPRLTQWQRIKKAVDPNNLFSSDQARRLKMAPA